MTNPSVRSVSSRRNNANVNVPSGVQLGDFLVIAAYDAGSGSIASSGFSYSEAFGPTSGGSPYSLFLTKYADSTDVSLSASAGTWALTGTTLPSNFAFAIQDADPSSAIRAVTGSQVPTNASNVVATSLASLTTGDLLLWFAGGASNASMFTAPAGSTVLTSGSGRTHAVSLTQASSGSSISFAATMSASEQWVTGLMAIKGVAGPPPVSNSAFLNFIR